MFKLYIIQYLIFETPGDLKNEESVLEWLTHQLESDEIEDVTDEMLDMLIEKSPSLAAFFCKFLTKVSS